MKTNDYLLLSGTAAYSFLFYQQNPGLNFLLFNLVVMILYLLKNKELWRQRGWVVSAILCLISGVAVLLHGNSLSVTANIVSLLILSGRSFNTNTSVIFSFLFSVYSLVGVWIHATVDAINRSAESSGVLKVKRGYMIYTWLAVSLLSVFFFFIYKQSNPLFAENTKWINLDFISWQWLLFTAVGFFCVYALLYHKQITDIAHWEQELPANTAEPLEDKPLRFEAEQLAGTLLFALLNVMLVILNVGDVSTIWFSGSLPKNVSHSDFVHDGVGAIIFSIVLAVSLMMYLYRKDYRNVKHSKTLKLLSYLWVAQNLLMLGSTLVRNNWYIVEYSLTYKRIGVYVWLLLATVGLCILVIKLLKGKSNWYLIKNNLAAWQLVLVLSGLLGWDRVITNYNLQTKSKYDVDYFYLLSLSDANIPELLRLINNPDFEKISNNATKTYERYYATSYQLDFRQKLSQKVKAYLTNYKGDWRSYNTNDARVMTSIKNFKAVK
ncbi:MAG: DUF4173 domain-containing protein [Bacteroidia bacterium]|nr:DUF4173 domain-containing protein [Bacteroidia bacterium]